VKKYSKKEIREAASSAIVGLLTRLNLPISGKAKKIVKDISKELAKQIADELKKTLKKQRKREKAANKRTARRRMMLDRNKPPVITV
jgi:electron transfer flavoprotein alpha/beta subunit